MSRAPNATGENRLSWPKLVGNPPARSTGLAHQVTTRLSSPAVTIAARPVRASLAAIQRVRVTLWFQASRKVPASSSRVTSGAPQKTPMMERDARDVQDRVDRVGLHAVQEA